MQFSIVVPCYNESPNLATLAEAFRTSKGSHANFEVILVDNGSTDDTSVKLPSLCSNPAYSFLRTVRVPKNRGYGYGILSGLAAATGEYVAWTHADLQTDPKDVFDGIQKLIASSNPTQTLVRGRRVGRPFLDAAFTTGMGWIASTALRTGLYDINAQPKIFHRSFLDQLGNAPWDFSLDLYVLYLAKKQSYRVIEIPVHFGKRHAGTAKGGGSLRGKWKLCVRTWKYIFKLRKDLVQNTLNPIPFDRSQFPSGSNQAAA